MDVNTKGSLLYNSHRYGVDKLYRDYYVSLFKDILNTSNIPLDIICGDEEYECKDGRKAIRVEFNYEHTLVAQGGRSIEGAFPGKIPYKGNECYLLRIDRYPTLDRGDIIIDYSIPNIHNVYISGLTSFAKKMVYIAPCCFELYHTPFNRSIDVLTTFINREQPRREALIQTLEHHTIPHVNRNNCFDKELLKALYKDTKILINIHQTDHHHTFEELRVLPALECGVIVISEVSALQEMVPYHEYVIWETYDGIVDRVKDILLHYDEYYNRIYNEPKSIRLDSLHEENIKRLRLHVESCLSSKEM